MIYIYDNHYKFYGKYKEKLQWKFKNCFMNFVRTLKKIDH